MYANLSDDARVCAIDEDKGRRKFETVYIDKSEATKSG